MEVAEFIPCGGVAFFSGFGVEFEGLFFVFGEAGAGFVEGGEGGSGSLGVGGDGFVEEGAAFFRVGFDALACGEFGAEADHG